MWLLSTNWKFFGNSLLLSKFSFSATFCFIPTVFAFFYHVLSFWTIFYCNLLYPKCSVTFCSAVLFSVLLCWAGQDSHSPQREASGTPEESYHYCFLQSAELTNRQESICVCVCALYEGPWPWSLPHWWAPLSLLQMQTILQPSCLRLSYKPHLQTLYKCMCYQSSKSVAETRIRKVIKTQPAIAH